MDDLTRRTLHDRLDAILDRRAALEPVSQNALASYFVPTMGYEDAHKLWRATIALAKDVLGDAARASALPRLYAKDTEQRRLLQTWLSELWPLLHAPPRGILGIAPQRELTIFEVMDGLSALDAGEIRPLFLANTGKNRRANRWSLARAKLEALVWKKRLIALGHHEKSANYEVTVAFGEQWDTIRKWRPQCEQILGAEYVAAELAYAGSPEDIYIRSRPTPSGLFGQIPPPDPLKSLSTAGSAYKRELQRSSELSKRKSRAAA